MKARVMTKICAEGALRDWMVKQQIKIHVDTQSMVNTRRKIIAI